MRKPSLERSLRIPLATRLLAIRGAAGRRGIEWGVEFPQGRPSSRGHALILLIGEQVIIPRLDSTRETKDGRAICN